MDQNLRNLYVSIKQRVDYGVWGRMAKYSIVRGCKTPGELFVAYKLDDEVTVVTLIAKADLYYIGDQQVTRGEAWEILDNATTTIAKHVRAEAYRNSSEARNTVVIDELDFHRQRDMATRPSYGRHHTTNPQKW